MSPSQNNVCMKRILLLKKVHFALEFTWFSYAYFEYVLLVVSRSVMQNEKRCSVQAWILPGGGRAWFSPAPLVERNYDKRPSDPTGPQLLLHFTSSPPPHVYIFHRRCHHLTPIYFTATSRLYTSPPLPPSQADILHRRCQHLKPIYFTAAATISSLYTSPPLPPSQKYVK